MRFHIINIVLLLLLFMFMLFKEGYRSTTTGRLLVEPVVFVLSISMINYSRGQFDQSKNSDGARNTTRSSENLSLDSEKASQERVSCGRSRHMVHEVSLDQVDSLYDPSERYTMEGGDFAPLLPPERYKGRVLSASSLRRRRKPGLLVDRKVESNRPRVVVDGVDDLRDTVTGLLARRLDALDVVARETKAEEKDIQQDLLAMDPSYEFAKAQVHPVDDRITPHTLHVLLRNSRTTVTRIHPPSLKKSPYYSFVSNKEIEQILAEVDETDDGKTPNPDKLSMRAEKPPIHERTPSSERKKNARKQRPPLKKDSRMVVKGQTPGEFMKRTACPKPENLDSLESVQLHSRRGDIFDQYAANQMKEIQQNDIHYLEPPNLVLANSAKYFQTTRDDEAPPDGFGISHPSVPLQSKHPKEKCMVYPPVPVRYATKEDEKRAMSLKRLAPRQGVRPGSGEKKAVESEHLQNLNESENKETFTICDDGRTPEQAEFLQFTFTTASRGEDTHFIEQLVRGFTADKKKLYQQIAAERKKRHIQPSVAPTCSNLKEQGLAADAETQDRCEPHCSPQGVTTELRVPCEPVFSVLEAILAVSREFEKIKQGKETSTWTDSALLAGDRRSAIERLVSFNSTRIPEQYWVSIQERSLMSKNREGEGTDNENGSRIESSGSIGGRPLDEIPLEEFSHLCNASRTKRRHADISILFPAPKPVGRAQVYLLAETIDFMLRHNLFLDALTDPTMATQILPPDEKFSSPTSETNNRLLKPEIQQHSDDAHHRYTQAAKQVIETLDIGLVELVRQVGSSCIERGALLDTLRQALVDVANSSVRILHHAKDVAFQEASKRFSLRKEMEKLEEQSKVQALKIRELEKENQRLLLSNDSLQLKATRMDLLLERIEAKRKRYELHSEDEHACLLLELEEDMIKTASKAVITVSEEKAALRDGPNQPSGEAPTAAEARKRVWDAKTAMQTLYNESAHLLKELHSATVSMNNACAPLYDKVALSALSPNANLVSAKWASIAHAVGEFEKEKSHRQRVFQVFTDWCERFKRERKIEIESAKKDEGEFLVDSSPENSSVEPLLADSAASFMSSSSHEDITRTSKKEGGAEGEDREANEEEDAKPEEEEARLQFITRQDLLEMNVFDCSPEEVNAMFERKFDFKSFLHTPWEPSSSNFMLSLTDVADMVHDVRVFLEELTIRMQAMCNSAVMLRGIEPPLQPPAHPDVPCPLCDRREMTGEKRKRQDALQSIAREVQHRMDELNRAFQKAESEREVARTEARRIQHDFDAALEREEELKTHLNEMLRARHADSNRRAVPSHTPPLVPMRSIIKSNSGTSQPASPQSAAAAQYNGGKTSIRRPPKGGAGVSGNNSTGNRPKRRRSLSDEVSDAPLPKEEAVVNEPLGGSELETTDELTLLKSSKTTVGTHADDDVPERSKSEMFSQGVIMPPSTIDGQNLNTQRRSANPNSTGSS